MHRIHRPSSYGGKGKRKRKRVGRNVGNNRAPIKIIVATNRKHNARSRDNSTGQGANERGTRTRVEGRKQNEHRRPKVIHEAQFERLRRTRRQTDRDGDRRFVEHE